MRFLDLFKGKKAPPPVQEESYEEFASRLLDDFSKNDHLGKAAIARDKARAAEADKDYNAAWRLYHEQKEQYLQHASNNRFTKTQSFALDASVSQQLANILRIEGKHDDALVHILYWVASSAVPTTTQQQKLVAYFSRCKFEAVSEAVLQSTIEAFRGNPDFMHIKRTVDGWRGSK